MLYATAPFLVRSDPHSYQLYTAHWFLLASFLIHLSLPYTHVAFALPLLPSPFQILPEEACEPHVYPAPDVGANFFFKSLARPAIVISTHVILHHLQGRRQGRASPGPAALGPPFLAGPTNPGPAGPRVFQPCRVRPGPRAMVDFKCDIVLYRAYRTVENYSSGSLTCA